MRRTFPSGAMCGITPDRYHVSVHLAEVTSIAVDYPEKSTRKKAWFPCRPRRSKSRNQGCASCYASLPMRSAVLALRTDQVFSLVVVSGCSGILNLSPGWLNPMSPVEARRSAVGGIAHLIVRQISIALKVAAFELKYAGVGHASGPAIRAHQLLAAIEDQSVRSGSERGSTVPTYSRA